MDVTRAQEIYQANERINVEFEGKPVWIEGIDNQSKTARVYKEGNPQDKLTVAVSELVEIQ
ncbi:MAG TPA: H-type small acid-soluble spore protein [Bacillota bacterium]|nr:H-type small acid-soluble spore protein [Bacillota bacterium]